MTELAPLPDLSPMSHSQKDELIFSLHQMLGDVLKQVDELKTEVAQLKCKVTDLQSQLSKNSRNSSKPPSSDGYAKPNPKSRRIKGQRPSGGQPGHEGSTLNRVENPHHIEICQLNECPNCGASLKDVPVDQHECRQVFDLPKMDVVVTEYQSQVKTCPHCDQTVKADFPSGITSPVQYGVGVKAAATYMSQYQLLPLARMQELFGDLFNIPISQGTLYNILSEGYYHLDAFETSVKDVIKASSVAHFDESGARVKAKLHWMHVASTQDVTHYAIHPIRGQEAMLANGILNEFKGCAIHDHWSSYYTFDCKHGLCNAHHLRELTYASEEHGQQWASKQITFLLDLYDEVQQAKQCNLLALPADRLAHYGCLYDRILNDGQSELPILPSSVKPKRGRTKQHKVKNLHDRFVNHKNEILAFVYDFSVPFDNNLAERDIRMNKVKQKISGCFRSEHGAEIFCRIRSYISTARKQSQNVLQALNDAFCGTPFIPARPE